MTVQDTLRQVLNVDYTYPITLIAFSTDPQDHCGTMGSTFDLDKIPDEFMKLKCIGYEVKTLNCIMYKEQCKLTVYVKLPLKQRLINLIDDIKFNIKNFLTIL
jgi:hypothetical protein